MSTFFAPASTLERPDLRLVGLDADFDRPENETQNQPVTIEAILDAPVDYAASLWTMQYAQQLADANGPIGIIHLESDAFRIDVVYPAHRAKHTRMPERSWPRLLHERSAHDLWRHWSQDAPVPISHWLIRVTHPRHEQVQTLLRSISPWTLAVQHHNCSIAAAYAMMKPLLDDHATGPNQRLSLLAVGCPHQAARDAHQRLSRLLFPGEPERLETLGNLRQIKPVSVRFMHRAMMRSGDLCRLGKLLNMLRYRQHARPPYNLQAHRRRQTSNHELAFA